PTVALSSTEAEYMAATHATKEAIWIRNFVSELGFAPDGPLRILSDNQGAIALTKNPTFHSRTKHIDVQFHFVRERVEEKSVAFEHCSTHRMVADFLTKPLTSDKFHKCIRASGLRSF